MVNFLGGLHSGAPGKMASRCGDTTRVDNRQRVEVRARLAPIFLRADDAAVELGTPF